MPTVWADTRTTASVASGAQLLVSLMVSLPNLEARFNQLTLLRTIVRMDLAATVRDTGEGDQVVDFGIGIASQDAFAAGAVSDPNVGADYPIRGWIWRSMYRVYGVAIDDQNVDVIRIDMDLRGKRKLENGEAFLVVNNAVNQGVAQAVQPTALIRQLWLVS